MCVSFSYAIRGVGVFYTLIETPWQALKFKRIIFAVKVHVCLPFLNSACSKGRSGATLLLRILCDLLGCYADEASCSTADVTVFCRLISSERERKDPGVFVATIYHHADAVNSEA